MYEYNINDNDNIDWLSKGKEQEKTKKNVLQLLSTFKKKNFVCTKMYEKYVENFKFVQLMMNLNDHS